jgi:serine/threonine protein kinase
MFRSRTDKPSGWTWQSKLSAILVQVLTALSKLDDMHIIHADIKPDKLMLAGIGRVKLIDLGCVLYASQADINTYIQTRFYRAPEILLGKMQTEKFL